MKELLLRMHLGLGDAIVCNALVRHLATKYDQVLVLCKPHNEASLARMWRDVKGVEPFRVADDKWADEAVEIAKQNGDEVLGLGFYGSQPFDPQHWDREMYRQAGLEFRQRWDGFKIDRIPEKEMQTCVVPFIFVHDDPKRGFKIDRSKLPTGFARIEPPPTVTNVIFDWWWSLENADEIHCIDSCFAILADSLPDLKAKRYVLHDYARKGLPPSYRKNWERLT